MWDLSSTQGSQLWMEFMALANHRKAIRSEIAAYNERFRDLEEATLTLALRAHGVDTQEFPPLVMSMLVASLARILVLGADSALPADMPKRRRSSTAISTATTRRRSNFLTYKGFNCDSESIRSPRGARWSAVVTRVTGVGSAGAGNYSASRLAANWRSSPDLILALPVVVISSARKNRTRRGTL